MKQPRLLVMGVLAVMLVAVLALQRSKSAATGKLALPDTDSSYWTCMLIAGTLGTVLGDFVAGDAKPGLANASVVLGILLAMMFYLAAAGC